MEIYDDSPEARIDVPLSIFEAVQARFSQAERLYPVAMDSVVSSGREQLSLLQSGTDRLGVILQRPQVENGAPEEMTVEIEERYKVNTHSSLRAIRIWRYYAVSDEGNDRGVYELRYEDGERVRRELSDREKLRMYEIITTSSINRI